MAETAVSGDHSTLRSYQSNPELRTVLEAKQSLDIHVKPTTTGRGSDHRGSTGPDRFPKSTTEVR